MSKESSEAFNSSGEGPGDFKKMVSSPAPSAKSWKEQKERNELTQDDEKRKAENAIGAFLGTIDGWRNGRQQIAKGPFLVIKDITRYLQWRRGAANGNLLARSYVLGWRKEILKKEGRLNGTQQEEGLERRGTTECKNRRRRRRRRRRRESTNCSLFYRNGSFKRGAWVLSTCLFRSVEITGREKGCESVAFHATNAWDKVGTKSVGLWDERVDIALGANTARHKLAERQRVKAVAYVPEIDSQPQKFLQFDVKEDFILAAFTVWLWWRKKVSEMVVPRPPCASNGFDISPIRIDGWRNRTSIPSARTRFATSGKSSRCLQEFQ